MAKDVDQIEEAELRRMESGMPDGVGDDDEDDSGTNDEADRAATALRSIRNASAANEQSRALPRASSHRPPDRRGAGRAHRPDGDAEWSAADGWAAV